MPPTNTCLLKLTADDHGHLPHLCLGHSRLLPGTQDVSAALIAVGVGMAPQKWHNIVVCCDGTCRLPAAGCADRKRYASSLSTFSHLNCLSATVATLLLLYQGVAQRQVGCVGQRVTGAGLSAAASKALTMQPGITPDVFQTILSCLRVQLRAATASH